MHDPFAGQHAIITGGTSGIGRALVDRLGRARARVSVIALADENLEELRAEEPPGVRLLAADVADRAQATEAVTAAEDAHGPADLVVTCAGVVRPGYFSDLSPQEHEREMAVNYFGTLWTIRAAAPAMVRRRRGAIMAVSSFAGLVGVFGYTAYCPSKFAVRGLCECLRAELKPHGVHVGCVFPPDTDTPMLAAEVPVKPPEAQASSMLPVLSADEVAHAILAGARQRRARVYPGPRTRAFARAAMALTGVTEVVNDRDVARHQPE